MKIQILYIFILVLSLFCIGNVLAYENIQTLPTSISYGTQWCNPSNIFDGNWSSYGYECGLQTGDWIYANYTIQSSNVGNISWMIKSGNIYENLTIPNICYNSGLIATRIFSIDYYNGNPKSFECYNFSSGSFIVIGTTGTGYNLIYEADLKWNYNTPISNINVTAYQTIQLPQINSSIPLVNSGLSRTYLYCTWNIGNQGQQAILMNGTLCPVNVQNYTFQGSNSYYARIDYANIFYNPNTAQWQMSSNGLANDLQVNYQMNIPEPSTSFLNGIYNTILNVVRGLLCKIFPFLGFCSN